VSEPKTIDATVHAKQLFLLAHGRALTESVCSCTHCTARLNAIRDYVRGLILACQK
jgi:hypothetical protein